MKALPLVKDYKWLTPEERFRLILNASGRDDEAERDRLTNAGGRITLSLQDHAPYANAFDELALLTFIELLEEAARYHDDFDRLHSAERGDDDEAEEKPEDESNAKSDEEPAEPTDRDCATWGRYLDLALASGYELRTTSAGWKLFCERLNIPPFLLWEVLPGFDRLQRALALAEKAAFTPEGFLRWLNRIRPAGQPELTTVPLTAEAVAKAAEEAFRKRVEWWGG